MLEFIRGKKDDLQGRVIVYGIIGDSQNIDYFVDSDIGLAEDVDCPNENNNIIAKLAAMSPKLATGWTSSSKKDIAEIARDFRDRYLTTHPDINPLDIATPIKIFYQAHSTEELLANQNDVISTGNHTYRSNCMETIDAIIAIYRNVFEQQTITKNVFTYDTVRPKKLRAYIEERFVGPMIEAMSCQDISLLAIIQRHFARFVDHTPISTVPFDIYRAVSSGNDYKLVDAYLDKIAAIACEDFHEVVKIEKKLSRIKATRLKSFNVRY